MKIRIEQLNPTIGDLTGNKELITDALLNAVNDGIDLLILPEMVVTGYPVQDLLESEGFREACYQTNQKIIEKTGQTAILFGSITPNKSEFGRKMFNSAILAKDGKVIGKADKTLLPTYDIFDDLRYFEPNKTFHCVELNNIQLGITICEDIWYNENEVQYHTYEIDPAAKLKEAGADIIINISASPYTKTKHENRESMIKNHAINLGVPVLYCNQVGAHTDVVFDGDSMAVDSSGNIVTGTAPFRPSKTEVEWKGNSLGTAGKAAHRYPESYAARHFKAISLGLSDYVEKNGITENVVIGLSGGIDSALVCTLAAEILGPENVTAITMPTEFSSEGSVSDSQLLANHLGVRLHEIPIQSVFSESRKILGPLFEELPFGVAEENLQSRIRGTLLMAYANKFNCFLLPTGNKSEYAVGYATLYGDMNGALAIIGDLYKTEVYRLAAWMNDEHFKKEIIPKSVLSKPPSAELRPNQKDSDSLPDYEVLDDILYHYIELQQTAEVIAGKGHSKKVVYRVIQMVDNNEFKRYQAAPILKLSSKSFGSGRRWPIVQKWTNYITG